MRKTLISSLILSLGLLFLLSGCNDSADNPAYTVNTNVTLTNMKIKSMEFQGGKFPYYTVSFAKDNGKPIEFDVDDWLYSDLENIKKTAQMMGEEKNLYFDVVTDGNKIICVTSSKNKK